ncbi:SPW repeat domain-containing protein [Mucilaginibacter sp. HD30]
MKFISRRTHAVLDYLVGILLIAAPWLLGFSDNNAATWCAAGVGIVTLLMSAITDYEGGLIKILPMSAHLTMDVITGIFLAVSPWLLGYSARVFLPHLIVGIMEILVVLFSQRTSQHSGSVRHSF